MDTKKMDLIRKEDDLIDKANILVSELFKDKFDKQGVPYIKHLYYVESQVKSYEEKVVALLHDVIEDTYVDDKILLSFGFPKKIVNAVKILTRNKEIPYDIYINSIIESDNLLALKVKQADMSHNMDIYRMSTLEPSERSHLIKKYNNNYKKITQKLEKRG